MGVFKRAQEILAFPCDCGDAFLRCAYRASKRLGSRAIYLYDFLRHLLAGWIGLWVIIVVLFVDFRVELD